MQQEIHWDSRGMTIFPVPKSSPSRVSVPWYCWFGGEESAFCFHVFDRFDIVVGWRSFSRILLELEIPKNGIIIPQKDIHNIESIESTSKHHLYSSFIRTAVHPIHDERASCTSWNRWQVLWCHAVIHSNSLHFNHFPRNDVKVRIPCRQGKDFLAETPKGLDWLRKYRRRYAYQTHSPKRYEIWTFLHHLKSLLLISSESSTPPRLSLRKRTTMLVSLVVRPKPKLSHSSAKSWKHSGWDGCPKCLEARLTRRLTTTTKNGSNKKN